MCPGVERTTHAPAVARQRLAARELVPRLEGLREVVDRGDRGDDREARRDAEAGARHVVEQELRVPLLPEVVPVERAARRAARPTASATLRGEAVVVVVPVREEDRASTSLDGEAVRGEARRRAPPTRSSVSGPESMSVTGSRRIRWTLTGPTGNGVGTVERPDEGLRSGPEVVGIPAAPRRPGR